MTEEIYKPIPGWEEYEVSTLGKVRKIECGTFVAQFLTGVPEYYYCNLGKAPKRKLMRVHRLVALAHIPNPDNMPHVDHINKDPHDNHVNNLRWVNVRGNMRNTKANITLPNGKLLLSAIEDDFGEVSGDPAYNFIYNRIKAGISYQEAVDLYDIKRKEDLELEAFKVKHGKNWKNIQRRLAEGWDEWSAVNNCPPVEYYKNSIEVGGVWYPSKKYIAKMLGISIEAMTSRLKKYPLEEVINGAGGMEPNVYTIEFNGKEISGTVNKLKKRTGLSGHAIRRRGKGDKTTSIVKYYRINGKTKTLKGWSEYFGLNPRSVSNYLCRVNKDLYRTLEHYGIDTSNLKITPLS